MTEQEKYRKFSDNAQEKEFKTLQEYRNYRILHLIPGPGQEPISQTEIRNRTGFTRRQITNSIRELRKIFPICSTKLAPGGYWMGNAAELEIIVKQLHCEANTIIETANNLKKHLEFMRLYG